MKMGSRIEALNAYAEVKQIQQEAQEKRAALECELGITRCAQHNGESNGRSVPRIHPADELPGKLLEELKADHDTRDAMRPLIDILAREYLQRWNIWAMRALQGLVGFGGADPMRSDTWYHDQVRIALTRHGAGLTNYLEIGVSSPPSYFPSDVDAARAVMQGQEKPEGTLS